MKFCIEENELSLTFLFARETKSTYTVTRLEGRIDEVEIIGNGTLVVWRVALADEVQYTSAASNVVEDSIFKKGKC